MEDGGRKKDWKERLREGDLATNTNCRLYLFENLSTLVVTWSSASINQIPGWFRFHTLEVYLINPNLVWPGPIEHSRRNNKVHLFI